MSLFSDFKFEIEFSERKGKPAPSLKCYWAGGDVVAFTVDEPEDEAGPGKELAYGEYTASELRSIAAAMIALAAATEANENLDRAP